MFGPVVVAALFIVLLAGLLLWTEREWREVLLRGWHFVLRRVPPLMESGIRTIVLTARILVLVSAVGAGVAFYLINAKTWHASRGETFVVGLAASITTATIQLISLLYDEYTPRRRRKRRRDAADVIRPMKLAIASTTDIPLEDIGVSVWRVSWSIFGSSLTPVAQAPSEHYGGPSDIRWTRGKGVIGEAWRSGKPCYADFRELLKLYPQGLTAEQFSNLRRNTPAILRRMDLREFNEIFGKYREVFAEPIKSTRNRNRGTVIGVLAVDLAMYRKPTPEEIDQLPMGVCADQVTDMVRRLASPALSNKLAR